jgi:hypothetical protein
MAYEPIWSLCDGHNEFYGALGVASHESMAAPGGSPGFPSGLSIYGCSRPRVQRTR